MGLFSQSLESSQEQPLQNTVNVWDQIAHVAPRYLEQSEWSASDDTRWELHLSKFVHHLFFGNEMCCAIKKLH